ncbi:MAG: hypothetical protein ACI86X_001317 [Moritella sp.]|jgi:hypothetical protein
MSSDTSKGIWIAVITGLLAIFGTAVKGVADLNLERAKLDSQLVLGALSSTTVELRRESLRFLVDADLISSHSTKEGLATYFSGDTPKSPPQMQPFIQSGESITLSNPTLENASKTDVDLFVCGSSNSDKKAESIIQELYQSIKYSNGFGTSKLKVWDGDLYNEVPEDKLRGYLTIIVDKEHYEFYEVPVIEKAIRGVNHLPPINVIDNSGANTPWRMSLILCL